LVEGRERALKNYLTSICTKGGLGELLDSFSEWGRKGRKERRAALKTGEEKSGWG